MYTLLKLSGHPLTSTDVDSFKKAFSRSKIDRQALGNRVSEWMMRRDKATVLTLPGKFRQIVQVDPTHRFSDEMAAIEADDQSLALVKIGKARRLLEEEKLLPAIEAVEGLSEEDKVILFVNFKESHENLMNALAARNIKAVGFTGENKVEDRQACVDKFQTDPRTKAIVMTIDAGYSGWTLTKANWVFMVSCPWTPSKLLQAEDRAYRFGQERRVDVAVFQVAGSALDAGLWEVLEYKADQARDVMEGGSLVVEDADGGEADKRAALELVSSKKIFGKASGLRLSA
jgi:SNF2 family DNA or RNA helicase